MFACRLTTWPSCVSAGRSRQHRQLGFELVELAAGFAVLGELLGVGVDDDHAAGAVDDDRVAAADFGGDVPKPDDGGDAHRAGDDRGVAGAPADVGGEALHVRAIERRGLAGQQVVGDDDHVLREVRQVFVLLADQVAQQRASRCRRCP